MSLRKGTTIISGNSSGGGGTSDYSNLTNKPQINNVTLTGNKSLSDLGIQGTINDLSTIRSGAALGATALQSYTESDPVFSASAAAGITSSNITSWNGKGTYSKPSGGIPKTDLASAVQTSLGKADSALQSVPLATSSTIGGLKVRLSGTTLYIRNDGNNA